MSQAFEDDDAIAREAARLWAAVKNARDPAEAKRAAQGWRGQDVRHERAWRSVETAMMAFDLAEAPGLDDLRAEARQAIAGAQRRRVARAVGIAGGALIAAGLTAAVFVGPLARPEAEVFETRSGERREARLADGSRLRLDGDTRIEARLTRKSRDVRLARGQARFDVASDPARPFTVAVNGRRVQAVGTSFNIDRLPGRSVITLLHGKVRIGSESDPQRWTATLVSGQQFVAADGAPDKIASVDPRAATAWSQGRLVFQDVALSDAVAQANRHGARLSVDPVAARLRITGVFRAGDRAALVEAVTASLPIRAEPLADGGVMLRLQGGRTGS